MSGSQVQPEMPVPRVSESSTAMSQLPLVMSETEEKQDDSTRLREPGLDLPAVAALEKPQGFLWTHLTANVKPSFIAECELIILTICTGMQDAVTFPDYHCFASNQTGNTVFLMLAIILPELNGEMFYPANIGTALGFFLAGGWLTGQLGHIVGPRCRLWLILCNFIQAIMVLVAGALQHVYPIKLSGTLPLIVIGLLAFASGSQVVQSRTLAMTEISTAMATAAWVDLLIDRRLFAADNRPRTRRVVFLICLVIGAILGAVIYRQVGSSVAVLVSGGGKLVVAFMYLFNESDKPKVDDEKV